MTITLVLGGARSGKSSYAQRAAEKAAPARGGQLVAVVTAEALDDEMRERIKFHKAARGALWRTVEAPRTLPQALSELQPGDIVVVDCLTFWLSNLLLQDANLTTSADALLAALEEGPRTIWLVSNEVGFGVVPDNALARRFRDECGRLHQKLAARADEVYMIMAGLPLKLK